MTLNSFTLMHSYFGCNFDLFLWIKIALSVKDMSIEPHIPLFSEHETHEHKFSKYYSETKNSVNYFHAHIFVTVDCIDPRSSGLCSELTTF